MRYTTLRVTACLLLLTAFFSCKKDPVKPGPVTIDLSQVRMNDFQLVETAYTNIVVTHPVITNGVETQGGEIRLTIPAGSTFQLTPKISNFTNSEFTVSPGLGVQQNFLGRTIIYTITSKKDASKRVHYAVSISEATQQPGQPQLNWFKFEKAKNPSLPADAEGFRTGEGPGVLGKVFVFVPEGTAFTSLIPTIGYSGTGLFYSQDPNAAPELSTTAYPAAGTAIDFKWPKVFYAVIKNGTDVKTYEVIVDVRAPIKFDNADVTTLNVNAGGIHSTDVTQFLNVGNHPITIASVEQTAQLPAGTAAVRGAGFIPSGGLLPGQRSNATATISAQTWPPGTYGVTSVFKPRLMNHNEADNLLESSPLRITTTIVQ